MIYHVFPVNDIKPHSLGLHAYCECNPTLLWTEDDQLIVKHNAFDYRDFFEELELYQRVAMRNLMVNATAETYKNNNRLVKIIGEGN